MAASKVNQTFGVLDVPPVIATRSSTFPAPTVFKITIHYETMKHNQRASASFNADTSSIREATTYVINHDPLAFGFAGSKTDYRQVP
jgi:hypothetical protein